MHSLEVWHWNWNFPHDGDDVFNDIGEEVVDVLIMSAILMAKGGDTVVVVIGATTSAFLALTVRKRNEKMEYVSITFQDIRIKCKKNSKNDSWDTLTNDMNLMDV